VQNLVIQGADMDKVCGDGDTPLLVAARNGNLAVVEYLVVHGADKNKA
jgi:ankyrin repeat protein